MAKLYSIFEIFDKRVLRIPDFQRGFSWGQRQLDDFWDDLEKVPQDRIHYTGLLTIEKVKVLASNIGRWNDASFLLNLDEGSRYTPYYIVDGQQRITTAIILITSILARIDANTSFAGADKKTHLQKFIKVENPNGKTFIFGYEKDDPSYEFLKTNIYKENAANNLNEPETLYTENLGFAKKYFDEKVIALNPHQLDTLFSKLVHNFKFNLYEVDEDLDVYVMFETMNNRGKPLSKLELLKNRLIYLSTKLDNSEEEINSLRNQINESWKTIYSYLGKNKAKVLQDDDFLKNHTYMYFGYMDKTANLFSEYLLDEYFTTKQVHDRFVTLENIENYVINIQKSVVKWFDVNFPFHQASSLPEPLKEWIDKINRLEYPPFQLNLMAVILSNAQTEATLKLLKAMDRYVFLVFDVFNSRSHTGRNLFNGFAHSIFNRTQDVYDLKTLISNRTESDTHNFDLSKFREYLNTVLYNQTNRRGYYGWSGIYYFLYEYEIYKQGNEEAKITFDKIARKDTRNSVEHIFPQTSNEVCWQTTFEAYNSDQQLRLKHSLGNLLLLSVPKNAAQSNKCFDFKKRHQAIGSSQEFVGYYNGSHSEIEVNAYEKWTAKEILERGIRMLKFFERRWEINLGDFENKKKLLYLDFLQTGEHEINLT
jgi:uncharacterized protein with ParB-like and HNH nuclease domain